MSDLRTFALVDASGVLTGFTHQHQAEQSDGIGIPVPADCDLVPGRYRWNAERTRFDPINLPPDGDRTGETIAIALALRALATAFSVQLPAASEAWVAATERRARQRPTQTED